MFCLPSLQRRQAKRYFMLYWTNFFQKLCLSFDKRAELDLWSTNTCLYSKLSFKCIFLLSLFYFRSILNYEEKNISLGRLQEIIKREREIKHLFFIYKDKVYIYERFSAFDCNKNNKISIKNRKIYWNSFRGWGGFRGEACCFKVCVPQVKTRRGHIE